MMHDFNQKLAFSMGDRERMDVGLIRDAIVGCVNVEKTDAETDKSGIDYVATLRKGARINIDAKTRDPGCSRWWRGEPELALEKWNVYPDGKFIGKTGWTLKEDSQVDMILYTFDPADSKRFYLIPFQHLRMAFIHNMLEWEKRHPLKKQHSKREDGRLAEWMSEAMFVPASVVISAVSQEMARTVA